MILLIVDGARFGMGLRSGSAMCMAQELLQPAHARLEPGTFFPHFAAPAARLARAVYGLARDFRCSALRAGRTFVALDLAAPARRAAEARLCIHARRDAVSTTNAFLGMSLQDLD